MTNLRPPHDPSAPQQAGDAVAPSSASSPLQGTDREIEQFIEMTFAAEGVPPPQQPQAPPPAAAEPALQEIVLQDAVVEAPARARPSTPITPLLPMADDHDDATRLDVAIDPFLSDDPLPLPNVKVQQPKRQLTLIGVDVREFLAAARQDGSRKWVVTLAVLAVVTVGVLGTGMATRAKIVDALSPVVPPPTAEDAALPTALQGKQTYVEAVTALQKNQLKAAQELFAKALTQDPTLVIAHRSLGIVHAKLRDTARAADHYRSYANSAAPSDDVTRVKQLVQAYDDAAARAHAEALVAAAAEEARVKAEAEKKAALAAQAQAKAQVAAARAAARQGKMGKGASGAGRGAPAKRRSVHPPNR